MTAGIMRLNFLEQQNKICGFLLYKMFHERLLAQPAFHTKTTDGLPRNYDPFLIFFFQ